MDKLKPLITHHFWLLFLVTLGLPPVAWWMTTGTLTEEIQARESKLNSDFGGISAGTGIPNDDWIQGVKGKIGIREEQNRLALDRLWKAQQGLMLWPPNVKQYMDLCPYRGELEDQRIREILPDLYRDDYLREVRRVWMLTEPAFDGSVRPDNGVPRKLYFPYASMPRVTDGKWDLLPPTWPEIWNSQEDLWLLSELFKAVQRVNAPTTSIVESYIKRITLVELFGGSRLGDDEIGSSASGGDSAGGAGGEMAIYGAGGPGGAGRGPGATGIGTSIRTQPAVFDLSEEFKVFGGGDTAGRGGYMTPDMGSGGGGTAGGSGDSTENDPNTDENRYVSSERAYRTRGFRIQVTIHQLQVPEFIRELLNAKYPVEIVRFQQMALNPDEPGSPGLSGAAGGPRMAMGTAGYPGGSGGSNYPAGGSVGTDAGSFEGAFDPTEYSEGESGDAQSPGVEEASGVSIQTALKELDLVDLVVVGELYLYNPPIVDEDGDGVPDEQPVEASGDAPAAPAVTTDGAVQPGVPGTAPVPGATIPGTAPAVPGTAPVVPGIPATTPPGVIPTPPPGTVPGTTPPATPPGSVPTTPGTVPATPGTVPSATVPGTVPAPAVPATPPPATTGVPATPAEPPATNE